MFENVLGHGYYKKCRMKARTPFHKIYKPDILFNKRKL